VVLVVVTEKTIEIRLDKSILNPMAKITQYSAQQMRFKLRYLEDLKMTLRLLILFASPLPFV
jgi:hypothetical protein